MEDLLLRLYEQRRRGPASSKSGGAGPASPDAHGGHLPGAEARPPGRLVLAVAQALTWVLKLDVVLFGGIRTGPFFGLLRPRVSPRGTAAAPPPA